MGNLHLTPNARKDIAKLRKENAKLCAKLLDLILDILAHPHTGIGKPEPLKSNYSGYWSRHINQKHRIIYKVEEDKIIIVSCYGHYNDK